jgi:hypothetical protein
MGQQLLRLPFDSANMTQGGVRVLIKEANKGFRFVGHIREPNLEAILEWYQLYHASSGQELLSYEAPTKVGYKAGFKCDEMLAENLKRMFFSGDPTDVAADAVAAAAAETVVAGKTGALHGLDYGRQTLAQRGDLAVYNVTDSALLVEDTDYAVVTQYGLTFVKMLVDTHAGDTIRFGEGATAATAYHYTKLAHKLLKPMTVTSLEVGALLQFPAIKGVNLEWRIWRASFKPTGLAWLSKEASNLAFELEVVSDSANHSTTPFGEIYDYGYDSAGAALI